MRLLLLLFVAGTTSVVWSSLSAQAVEVDGPEVYLRGIPFNLTIRGSAALDSTAATVLLGDGTTVASVVVPPLGEVTVNNLVIDDRAELPLRVVVGPDETHELSGPVFVGFLSLLPPLVAIVLAFAFREVVTSLFAGIWLGALFLGGFNPITATFDAANRFGRNALADPDHAAIILFTMVLGGMVGLVGRIGGMQAVVERISPMATTRRRGQLATWLAGLAVFFDDYSNSLIVGNTMRPLTDRLKISREKLAYIVDSTAAPVAAVFFVSTWIGYEVGLIGGGLEIAAGQHSGNLALVAELESASPFSIFLQTIPHLFYPLFAVVLVATLAISGRDFGPMLTAERRANSGGGLFRPGAQLAANPDEDVGSAEGVPPGRWWNGAIPVGVLVVTVLFGVVKTGIDALGPTDERTLRNIFGSSDPYSPLVWGSVLASISAIILALSQRILTLSASISAWLSGVKSMVLAVVILVMAWSLGEVTQTMGAPQYLASNLSETLPPQLLPSVVFVVAAVIAFATGTSWATMAILLPLVVPLSITMVGTITPEGAGQQAVLLGGIGSVLAGAIMGDHCSPISDTTVLSSTASSCDHVDHVRTQLPYALFVGVTALVFGSLPTAFGLPAWMGLVLGTMAIIGFVRLKGQPVEDR